MFCNRLNYFKMFLMFTGYFMEHLIIFQFQLIIPQKKQVSLYVKLLCPSNNGVGGLLHPEMVKVLHH